MKMYMYALLFFFAGAGFIAFVVLFSRSHGGLQHPSSTNNWIIAVLALLVAVGRFTEEKPLKSTLFGPPVMLHLGFLISYFVISCVLKIPDHFSYFALGGYLIGIAVGIGIRYFKMTRLTT